MDYTIDRFCSVGTALPSTAKVGRLFFLIDPGGNKLYACKTANTWVEVTTLAETPGITTDIYPTESTVIHVANGLITGSAITEIDPATGEYKTS